MKKNKLIILLILFFIFHSLYSVEKIIKIATGNPDGVYYQIGNSIKKLIEKDKYSDIFIGKTFQKTAEIINNNCSETNPVILIGVRRAIDNKETIMLNPLVNCESKNGKFDIFNAGDAMVVIARSQPDLSKIKKQNI
jgi:hypothetical protein